MEIFHNDWAAYLDEELKQPYYQELRRFLIDEYRRGRVYPDMYDIFNALHYTPYAAVKVVILGQDPYHGPGQAHGLSFSVQPGVAPPPSLLNIFKELQTDLGCRIPNNGCLKPWPELGGGPRTPGRPGRAQPRISLRARAWETFTDKIITLLNAREKPLAFILWGGPARKKKSMIDTSRHFIVESPHPSPLSASYGFFGSRPFSKVNAFLESVGETPVDWQLPDI